MHLLVAHEKRKSSQSMCSNNGTMVAITCAPRAQFTHPFPVFVIPRSMYRAFHFSHALHPSITSHLPAEPITSASQR